MLAHLMWPVPSYLSLNAQRWCVPEKFEEIAKQIEAALHSLKVTVDPIDRKTYLLRIRSLIDEADRLLLAEDRGVSLDSH